MSCRWSSLPIIFSVFSSLYIINIMINKNITFKNCWVFFLFYQKIRQYTCIAPCFFFFLQASDAGTRSELQLYWINSTCEPLPSLPYFGSSIKDTLQIHIQTHSFPRPLSTWFLRHCVVPPKLLVHYPDILPCFRLQADLAILDFTKKKSIKGSLAMK